jgi:hypothetical protein
LNRRAGVIAALAVVGAVVLAARLGGGGAIGDLQVATRAIETTGPGSQYWSQCQASGVPFPRPWGRATVGDAPGQWTARGTLDDSYISPLPVDVYTLSSASPPGVCAIAIRADGTFDVICQGTNGNTCFWEAEPNFWPKRGFASPPPKVPATELPIVGLVPAAPDQSVACTQCHAGENAFITHVTAGHPTNQRALAGWLPSATYTPIIPKGWIPNAAVLSASDYPRSCLGGCHDVGAPAGAGRLPRLRDVDARFCELLKTVTSTPASRGGMPPRAADCTPSVDCPLDVDGEVKQMMASCGSR